MEGRVKVESEEQKVDFMLRYGRNYLRDWDGLQ